MLGEITHLQGIIDDLTVLTSEPHKLPPASEQVQETPSRPNHTPCPEVLIYWTDQTLCSDV